MSSSDDTYELHKRAKVRRIPKRGQYDKVTVHGVIDECLIAHISFSQFDEDLGCEQPITIPMAFGREDGVIYLHGAAASRLLKTAGGRPRAGDGARVCLSFTIVDGLVIARSLFHHSMNYRSCVVFGFAELIEQEDERMHALEVITNHLIRGQWDAGYRTPNSAEMKSTRVIKVVIDNATAKIREGPPGDDEEDLNIPVWAGVVPVKTVYGPLIDDPNHPPIAPAKDNLSNYTRS